MSLYSQIFYELWPTAEDSRELNPESIFTDYQRAVAEIQKPNASGDDTTLLELSWKLFENDSNRRNSIESRASALMPAITIAATLVVGVGFTTFKDASRFGPTIDSAMFLTYAGALIYLTRTVLVLFRIHGKVIRHTPDPLDIVMPSQAGVVSLSRAFAAKLVSYTIENYKINNEQLENLIVAQRTFRNGLLVIATGGVITALALMVPPHCSYSLVTPLPQSATVRPTPAH